MGKREYEEIKGKKKWMKMKRIKEKKMDQKR